METAADVPIRTRSTLGTGWPCFFSRLPAARQPTTRPVMHFVLRWAGYRQRDRIPIASSTIESRFCLIHEYRTLLFRPSGL